MRIFSQGCRQEKSRHGGVVTLSLPHFYFPFCRLKKEDGVEPQDRAKPITEPKSDDVILGMIYGN